MPTLSELRYNVLNIKGGGRQSDDETMSQRQAEFQIAYMRSILIRRDYEKGRSINPAIIQDLGCVEIEPVDEADCCQVQTGCQILRTVNKVPTMIEVYNKNLITYVGTVDKRHFFDMIPAARSRFVGAGSKYTAKKRRWFPLNDYIYVIYDKPLKYINIRGVLEDPSDAAAFNHCTGTPCFDDNSEYPLASWMIQPITDMIIKGEFKESMAFPPDTKNEAAGSIVQNSSQPPANAV